MINVWIYALKKYTDDKDHQDWLIQCLKNDYLLSFGDVPAIIFAHMDDERRRVGV